MTTTSTTLPSEPTLAVVPTYVRSDDELDVTITTLRTLREVEPDLDVLVVDDCSPDVEHTHSLLDATRRLGVELSQKAENEGYSKTVNVGLQRALDGGMHAITLNADMEFYAPFVERMIECRDSQDRPAAVVGGLLLFPTGLIQHGGIYFSLIDRNFDHRFRFGPGALPEAQLPKICPVTGAMQFIRHSTLEKIGLYDTTFSMGHEDVSYCLDVFEAGLECVYDPGVRAIHHESMFRSAGQEERHAASWARLIEKHKSTSLGQFVPDVS